MSIRERYSKFKKWKQKRIAKRADKDVKVWRRVLRYSINILIIFLIVFLSNSVYAMYQKYTTIHGIANMEAVMVDKNDIKYQKKADEIFVEHSIDKKISQFEIDELIRLFEKTSKSEAITSLHELIQVAWKEYTLRIVLQEKIEKNDTVTQGEVDEYFLVFNELNQLLSEVESEQKKEWELYICLHQPLYVVFTKI